ECAGSASNNDHLTSFDYRWKQLHNINGSMLLAIERYRWNHGGGERDGADEREWEKPASEDHRHRGEPAPCTRSCSGHHTRSRRSCRSTSTGDLPPLRR